MVLGSIPPITSKQSSNKNFKIWFLRPQQNRVVAFPKVQASISTCMKGPGPGGPQEREAEGEGGSSWGIWAPSSGSPQEGAQAQNHHCLSDLLDPQDFRGTQAQSHSCLPELGEKSWAMATSPSLATLVPGQSSVAADNLQGTTLGS